MKNFRKLAGISILLVFAAMIAALVQFEEEEEAAEAPAQVEFFLMMGGSWFQRKA